MFPLARVKRIMKSQTQHSISNDALIIAAKTLEIFIEHLAKETEGNLKKRKMMTYDDVAAVVDATQGLDFLAEGIPVKRLKKEVTKDEDGTTINIHPN